MFPVPRRNLWASWARLLPLSLFCVFLGRATVVPRMDLNEIVDRSARVVHGTVISKRSAWDANRTAIWTHYEIQAIEALKGASAASFTVSEPGGIVGEVGMAVSGAPEFRVGDEVVVFLYRTPIGYWRVRGYGQGKFTVLTQPNGEKAVRNDLYGITLVDPAPQDGFKLRRAAASPQSFSGMSLSRFKEVVRSLLNRAAEGEGN